jgi:hypothetical protein
VPFFLKLVAPALDLSDGLTVAQTQAIGSLLASGNAMAMAPVNIGILPAGRQVTITFDARVKKPLSKDIIFVSNQGTVSGSNFVAVQTDDPDTTGTLGDPTITLIDNLGSDELPSTGETPWWRNWLLLVSVIGVAIITVSAVVRRKSALIR